MGRATAPATSHHARACSLTLQPPTPNPAFPPPARLPSCRTPACCAREAWRALEACCWLERRVRARVRGRVGVVEGALGVAAAAAACVTAGDVSASRQGLFVSSFTYTCVAPPHDACVCERVDAKAFSLQFDLAVAAAAPSTPAPTPHPPGPHAHTPLHPSHPAPPPPFRHGQDAAGQGHCGRGRRAHVYLQRDGLLRRLQVCVGGVGVELGVRAPGCGRRVTVFACARASGCGRASCGAVLPRSRPHLRGTQQGPGRGLCGGVWHPLHYASQVSEVRRCAWPWTRLADTASAPPHPPRRMLRPPPPHPPPRRRALCPSVRSGVGARRVRETFAKLRQAAPAILFVDEFDALGAARGAQVGPGPGPAAFFPCTFSRDILQRHVFGERVPCVACVGQGLVCFFVYVCLGIRGTA